MTFTDIALTGNVLVLGCRELYNGKGAALVFLRSPSTGQWNQVQEVRASDEADWNSFGVTVSMNRFGYVAFACFRDDEKGSNAGAVYVGQLECAPGWTCFDSAGSLPEINSIFPSSGYVTGNYEISFNGHNFDLYRNCSSLVAKFIGSSHTLATPANCNSSTLITCTTPLWPHPESVTVEVGCLSTNNFTNSGKKFQYYSASVASFAPLSGPATGNTVVNITGTGLDSTGSAWCRFEDDGHIVSATVQSSTWILCTAPSYSTSSYVKLSVSLNGQQYMDAPSNYRYYNIVPQSLTPHWGPKSGGTVVQLNATDMEYRGESIKIKLQSVSVPSTVVDGVWSNGTVQFTVPDLSAYSMSFPYTVGVYLSPNGQLNNFAPIPLPFYVYSRLTDITLSTITPTCGPADGNANATIKGSNFIDTGIITVKAGSLVLPAFYVDSNTILVALSSSMGAFIASISISLNGQQFSPSSVPFTYYQVQSISPDLGPSFGSTPVVVHGSGFANHVVMCKFGTLPAIASYYVSPTEIRCTSPPAIAAGSVPLEITCNGKDFTSSVNAQFFYFDLATVSSVSPSSSYDFGNEDVTIRGSGFLNRSSVVVVFAEMSGLWVIPATNLRYVSDTTLHCTVPSIVGRGLALPFRLCIEVQQNGRSDGQGTSSPSVEFTYIASGERSVQSASPALGPASGGHSVLLTGSGFGIDGNAIDCRYRVIGVVDMQTQGVTLSDTTLRCLAPSMVAYMSSSLTFDVEVSIALKNLSLGAWSAGLPYRFYRDPIISSVQPSSSYSFGNITVDVTGTDFFVNTMTKCRFGDDSDPYKQIVDGMVKDATLAQCQVPSHPLTSSSATTVPVYVSLNGVDFTASNASFTYIPCPVGTYSKIYSDPCTPCLAGFYSPLVGAVACLECTKNYYCVPASTDMQPCPLNTVSGDRSKALSDCTCEVGSFNRQGMNGLACEECSVLGVGAICPGGTSRPFPLPGFWNSQASGDFSFYSCPAGNIACSGGTNATNQCSVGYTGRMCSQCLPNYYKLEHMCIECPDTAVATVVILSIVFVSVIWLLKRFGGLHNSGGVLSISVSYIQITALFADFRLLWAEQILAFISSLSFINLNIDIASPECIVSGWGYQEKFAFTMFLPLMAAFILLLLHGMSVLHFYACVETQDLEYEDKRTVWRWFGMHAEKPNASLRGSVNAFLTLLSLMYIILATKSLEPFDCTLIHGGKYSLDSYPDIECWAPGGPHMSIVPWAYFCVIIYVVGIPASFIILLFRNRARIGDFRIRQSIGSLYGRYASGWFWWEVIIMARKLIMVLIRLNPVKSPVLQGIGGEVVLLLALSIHMFAQPFAQRHLNVLESALLFCNFLVLLSGLMFLADKWEPPGLRVWATSVTIVLLSLSLVMIALFAIAEIRSILRYLQLRRFKKGIVWDYWRDHLPQTLLHAWIRSTSSDSLNAVEKYTQQICELDAGKDIVEHASSIHSVLSGNQHDLLHMYHLLAYHAKVDNSKGHVLLDFLRQLNEVKSQAPKWMKRFKKKVDDGDIELDVMGEPQTLGTALEMGTSVSQIHPEIEDSVEPNTRPRAATAYPDWGDRDVLQAIQRVKGV